MMIPNLDRQPARSGNTPRRWRCLLLIFLIAVTVLVLVPSGGAAPAAEEVPVPVIKGDVGSCSADFTVKDIDDKPIYNAKIRVSIKYGFMGQRKTELEIGTNSDGKARFEGLPTLRNRPKGPFEYQITSGELRKRVVQDPALQCEGKFSVVLQK